MDHAAHAQAQGNTALLYRALGIQNAAGVVEPVESSGYVNAVAGNAGRVVLVRGGYDLGGEGSQQAEQCLLGGVLQGGGVHTFGTLEHNALLFHLFSREQMRACAYWT